MVRKPGWHGRVPSPPRSRRASCSSWTHRRGRSRRSTRSLPNTAPHTRSTRLGPTASVSPSLSTGTPPSLRSTSAPPPSPAAAAGASSVVEKVVAASRSPLVPTLRPTSTLGRRLLGGGKGGSSLTISSCTNVAAYKHSGSAPNPVCGDKIIAVGVAARYAGESQPLNEIDLATGKSTEITDLQNVIPGTEIGAVACAA